MNADKEVLMRITLSLSIVLTTLIISCQGTSRRQVPHVASNLPNPTDAQADLVVCTWNVALAPGINLDANRRVPHVIEYLRVLMKKCDVVVLQEVWRPVDAAMIINTLGLRKSQWHYVDTRGWNENPTDHCKDAFWQTAYSCMKQECGTLPREFQTICARRECQLSLAIQRQLYPACFTCMVAGVSHSVDAIKQQCTVAGGATKVYNGGSGVMLLTRKHFGQKSHQDLPASSANRTALKATLYGVHVGPTEIIGVHLSSTEPLSPVHPDFDSWVDEKNNQMRLVHQLAGPNAIVAGDFNAGPAYGHLDPESIEVWDYITSLGYRSPLVDGFPPQCTACNYNLARNKRDKETAIDHVLLPPALQDRLQPVFVEVLPMPTLEYCEPKKYRPCRRFTAPISDHEPVRVGFNRRK